MKCAICMDDVPLHEIVCLPCQRNGRHCSLCRNCLDVIIDQGSRERTREVKCPICRAPFDVDQLVEALEDGCLDAPTGISEDYITRFYDDEPPEKVRCIEDFHRPR